MAAQVSGLAVPVRAPEVGPDPKPNDSAALDHLTHLQLGTPSHGSVRRKLLQIVMLTTATAVSVAGIAMLTRDLSVYRQSWAADLANEAAILALSTAPALEFDDQQLARRNLTALQARPNVLAAALYSANGRLYSSYTRDPQSPPPAVAPPLEQRISGERVELAEPVVRNGERLGTIYLLGRYDVTSRIEAYLSIFLLVMSASLAVAYVLSSRLQRTITEPLEAMARVAQGLVTRRDYSLRAPSASNDEIGIVVRAFNNMLDEVEARDRASAAANAALQAEIEVRQATEAALSVANARLDSTLAASEVGSWVWDLRADEFKADRNLAVLFGRQDAHELSGKPDLHRQQIHAEDLASVRAADHAALNTGMLPSTEFRVMLPNGTERWVARRGKVQSDAQGGPQLISGLMIDITAQKSAEEALREADRRKDEFLATLAHELRNPLAPIRHAVRLLDAAGADSKQRKWGQSVIARQVQRMALLLDDLLDVSRITRGRLTLKIEVVDLHTVVDAAIEVARPMMDAKKQTLHVSLPEERLMISADPLRLSQSLSNLLTNASKYTDEQGSVILTVQMLQDGIKIAVKDNGIGLDPNAIPGLFEIFSQLDSAIDRSEGGLGIGLALVKGLIALHGGIVEAVSEGLGKGSEFSIRLPQSMVVPDAESPGPAPSASSVTCARRQCTVLVIDDNRDAADSMAALLQLDGYEVQVAHLGRDGLDMAERFAPEAILLDIGLPDVSGYEVARRIRQHNWGEKMLLVALTGWGQATDKALALAAGFDHHLTKPVDVDTVLDLLHAFSHQRISESAQR